MAFSLKHLHGFYITLITIIGACTLHHHPLLRVKKKKKKKRLKRLIGILISQKKKRKIYMNVDMYIVYGAD